MLMFKQSSSVLIWLLIHLSLEELLFFGNSLRHLLSLLLLMLNWRQC